MAIKTYLISCFIILANSNVYATIDDCEESEAGHGEYFASGSAHSSQFLLPSGDLVTHSKGSSYSSGGIKETFEKLKHEANQFVTKQKETLNIPNILPPLHSGFGQDLHLHQLHNIDIGAPQTHFNQFESSSQQKETINGGQTGQVYYQPAVVPSSQITSTKKEQFQVNKKVITHASPVVYPNTNEEIETNQNTLDYGTTGNTRFQYVPSSFQNTYQSNANKEIETLDSKVPVVQKIQTVPYGQASSFQSTFQSSANKEIETLGPKVPVVQKIQTIPYGQTSFQSTYQSNANKEIETSDSNVPIVQKIQTVPYGQTSYSKYENTVKHNSTSQVVPSIPAYIPTGTFTSGIIDFTKDAQNVHVSNLTPFVSNKVPSKIISSTERHYDDKESYGENTLETNTHQKESKFNAIPSNRPELPIKIKYTYDGKNLLKTEEYSSGLVKPVPISIEEYENTLKEIHRQESQSSHSPKPEEGYYYPRVPAPTSAQTFKQESSHSHQITSGDSLADRQESQSYHSLKPEEAYYPRVPAPTSVQTFKKEESSHSHQTITSGDSLAEQLSHLPLQVDSQKQYYPGYAGIIPPVSASQISEEKNQASAASHVYSASNPAILVRGVPYQIPIQNQFSDGAFQSSHFSNGGHAFSSEFANVASEAHNSALEKLATLDRTPELCTDCITGLGVGKVPLKNSYGISTSFSSSSTNVNGKKTENRKASVTVNDNGKVDTYNVKS